MAEPKVHQLFDLSGKIALVTGGARNLGRDMACALAEAGADVAITGRSLEAARKTATEITEETSRRIAGFGCDVRYEDQVIALVDAVLLQFGRIDILVNNAAIWIGGSTLDTKEEDWDNVIAVNLKGPFNCSQEAAGIMVGQRYGKIINISSISGLGGAPQGELAYCCAKAGLIAMTTVNAQDLSPHGISVNCIAPGWIRTDMTTRQTREQTEELQALKAAMAAARRIGEPQDIANLALFLASDESSFVTGQVIVADGGRRDFLSHA
jgi:3-oxoacyl-[acyl-carrier protein] reductase